MSGVENFRLRRISSRLKIFACGAFPSKQFADLAIFFFSQKTAPYSARFANSGRLAAPDSEFFFGAGDVRGQKNFGA